MHDRDIIKNGPCPVCWKPEGAFMGSSTWGHDVSCCSDTCGLKVSDRLKALYLSGEYRTAVDAMTAAMNRVAQLKADVVASFQPQT